MNQIKKLLEKAYNLLTKNYTLSLILFYSLCLILSYIDLGFLIATIIIFIGYNFIILFDNGTEEEVNSITPFMYLFLKLIGRIKKIKNDGGYNLYLFKYSNYYYILQNHFILFKNVWKIYNESEILKDIENTVDRLNKEENKKKEKNSFFKDLDV
jgi:hypothetical protein